MHVPRDGVTNDRECLNRYWEPSSGPLQEKSVFLTHPCSSIPSLLKLNHLFLNLGGFLFSYFPATPKIKGRPGPGHVTSPDWFGFYLCPG